MTNEAVLDDPQTIEWMGSRKASDDGPRIVRIFGHTESISLLKTLIEVETGVAQPRPVIKGLKLREERAIARTNSAVDRALERSRAKLERERLKAERHRQRKKQQDKSKRP